MTAIDVFDVLKRTDGQFARRSGDDPATPEYLKKLADAVRPLVVNGKPAPAVPAVDDAEVKQLRADKQRAEDIAAERLKAIGSRDRLIERQKAAFEAAQGELTQAKEELNEVRAERDTARGQLRDAEAQPHGGVELLQADNARLANELAAAQRDLAAANRTLDQIADEEAARPPAVHACQWPVAEPGAEPSPCECGKPWPLSAAVEVEEVVLDVDPWADLFGQIRGEASEAGWTA